MRLGDLLVSSGIITGEQLEQALARPCGDGQRLGDVLIRQGVISEAQLIDALRVQLGVDFVDLTAVSIPVELAKYVPRNLAKKFLVVPVKLVQDRLYLAMHDPLDFVAQDEVKTASRKRIIPMIATRKAVEQAIERLYGSEGTARVIEEMKREAGAGEDIIPAQMARDTADPEASAPTIRFVNSLIERAFTERASDIHLEPQEGEMLVRMRIDGLLQRVLTVPADLQNTVISRLKIMGGMNIAEHKVPQDGHAMFSVRGHSLDLRIASMPTVYGEKIVLRLLDKSSQVLDKSVLGLEGRDLDNYNALLKNTSGVVLLVGPTGSGKSTTMSNMLRDLSSDALNIVTLEDPVEYHLPGVNQCQINEKTGMTFASGLRAILRQDPDIIAVGEIRDGETASIAMRAAITGHLVFSTLHTNDAVSAVHRLEDIGVEPWLVSSALRGVGDKTEQVAALVEHLKKDGHDFTVGIPLDTPISQAERVVSAGKGIGGQKKMKLIEDLAKAAGAAIGSSRPVAETLKYLPLDRYVGMSGQKFTGNLYIACGISGATQHLKGIKDASTIVAINKSGNAPIFKNCDYGIVGDVMEILPLLTAALDSGEKQPAPPMVKMKRPTPPKPTPIGDTYVCGATNTCRSWATRTARSRRVRCLSSSPPTGYARSARRARINL